MKTVFKDRLIMLMDKCGENRPYVWAGKMGIEIGLFQYYWQKGGIPTVENLIKIQNYTGCSLDWLLTGRIVTTDDRFESLNFKSNKKDIGASDLALMEDFLLLKKLHNKNDKGKKAVIIREVLKVFVG